MDFDTDPNRIFNFYCTGAAATVPPHKVYILDQFARSNPNYSSWLSACPAPFEIVDSFGPDWIVPDDTGLIVTHLHYRWEEIHALRRIVEENKYPVLILSDGILEFRNTWQNPTIGDGSIFQPLIGHKLACIGWGQARVVESWGNVGQCEVVGLPRLDAIADNEFLPIQHEGPFRLLIASANRPAFTSDQRDQVLQSLWDLRTRLENNPFVAGRPVEVQWRLTDGLESQLGISSEIQMNSRQCSVTEAIEYADAVITTPSTLYLESVLKRRPTAILDYTNSPQYVSPAWHISAARHLNPILEELANPPAPKLLFQRTTLHDQLECATPATPRMLALITDMIEIGAVARSRSLPIEMPYRMLEDPRRGLPVVEAEFDRAILYPDNPVFVQRDVTALQLELSQAICRLGQLPQELNRKNSDLVRKDEHIGELQRLLDEAWKRVAAFRGRESRFEQIMQQKAVDIDKKNKHIESLTQFFHDSQARVRALRSELESQWITQSSFEKNLREVFRGESTEQRRAA